MISKKEQTVSFYTFGCRLNQSETAVIRNSMKIDGFRVIDFKEPADIVVVNTCTVTENGDADTRRLVNKINRINPTARIALIGCQAQTQKEKLADLKNVFWVIGNSKKFNLAEILKKNSRPRQPEVIAPSISRESFTIPIAGIDSDHTRANIKIQDGCDFFCSFCEIPYARGRARSRKFEDILKEVRSLSDAGHKEIVLTGINIGTYNDQGYTFLDVIDAVEQISAVQRIRISSIEPTTIPLELFDRMNRNSKLCRYLHIPLQSGNNNVLRRMQRKYTVEEFVDFIREAYRRVEEICIGTDVIVGFPGETEEQFRDTFNLLLEEKVHYFHVFSYSKRHLARSRLFTDELHPKVIQERSQLLRDLSQRKRRIYWESFLGTTQDVLFEQKKEGLWSGLTDNYARIFVESSEELANQIYQIRPNSLIQNGLKADCPLSIPTY